MRKIFAILFLINSFLIQAQVIHYVSTSGTDSGTGHTQGAPWLTLAYAMTNAATPGDTIALKKGDTFSISATVQVDNGGASGLPIVWDGSLWGTGLNAIVQKSQSLINSAAFHIAACDYVIFQNITVDGNGYDGDGIVVGGWLPVYGHMDQNDEDSIIIQGCKVTDCGAAGWSVGILVRPANNDMYNIIIRRDTVDGINNEGIAFYAQRDGVSGGSGPHDSRIDSNYVTNCGRLNNGVGAGIMVVMEQDSTIVERNTFVQGVSGHAPGIAIGIDPEDPTIAPQDLIVRYNDITAEGHYSILIQGGGPIEAFIYYNILHTNSSVQNINIQSATYTGADINFYNNIILTEGNTGGGFYSDGGPAGIIEFKNNIIFHTGNISGGNYPFYSSVANAVTHNNNLYHRTLAGAGVYFAVEGSTIYTRTTVDTWEPTCVKIDPLFTTNYTNLHLQAGSPAINMGVGVGLNLDYDGYVIDANPDIGAFEYGAAPPDIPPDLPTITTSTPTIVYTRLAKAGGNVTDDGGGTVSDRGICWGTSVNPTISDAHVHIGTGTGAFTVYMTGLAANTTYHVRAWGINPTGIAYGPNITFTTPVHSVSKTGGKTLKTGGKTVIIH